MCITLISAYEVKVYSPMLSIVQKIERDYVDTVCDILNPTLTKIRVL